jgi:hypothetical protein
MTARTTIRIALPIALLLAAATARAQSEPSPAARSYHWQATVADAAAMTSAVAGFSLEGKDGALGYVPSNTLMTVGISGYFLGAPIIHAANKHYGRGAASLVMRVGLPIVGAWVASRFTDCTPDKFLCGLEELGKGMMTGAAVAVVIDNVLLHALSGDDAEPAPAPVPVAARPRAPTTFTLAPRLAAGPNAAMFGVGGQF